MGVPRQVQQCPNCQALTWRKLASLCQGDSSVEELIQEFEIHGPISRLGDIGLVDCFKQAIHPHLQESIYWLEPMPTTWAEWKCKTSLLHNQWRGVLDTHLKAAPTKRPLFHSPLSKPSATAAPPAPQPMDLDHTNPVKKDPCSSLCFNCGKLGHIAKVCRGPHAQNVQNINAVMTLRLAPEDLQLLIESVRAVMVSSAPMTPPHESEGEKTPGEEGF